MHFIDRTDSLGQSQFISQGKIIGNCHREIGWIMNANCHKFLRPSRADRENLEKGTGKYASYVDTVYFTEKSYLKLGLHGSDKLSAVIEHPLCRLFKRSLTLAAV